MLPATRNKHALVSEWLTACSTAPKAPDPAQPDAERQDAHVLDAGIGQHALEVGLAEDEHRRHGHRQQAEDHAAAPG